jgi:hypothetical protein
MNKAQRAQDALTSILSALHQSLHHHMPPGTFREFLLWAISANNPYQGQWLEVSGIQQLTHFTVQLLHEALDDDQWQAIKPYYTQINSFFFYEIISDSLAFGLTQPSTADALAAQRRQLLSDFNEAMIERILGDVYTARQRMGHVQLLAQGIPVFEYSLNREKCMLVVGAFLARHPDLTLEDIAFDVGPVLIANMESGVELPQMVNSGLDRLLRTGMSKRYWAVNQELNQRSMTLREVVEVATWTVSVVPTLTFYMAAVVEATNLKSDLHSLVESHHVERVLMDAAFVVRLLNDLGPLVTLSTSEQDALVHQLAALHRQDPDRTPTFSDLILEYAQDSSLVTRLYKDIKNGEFNVALYNLVDLPEVDDALLTFRNNLAQFARIYTRRQARLVQNLDTMSDHLNDERLSAMIQRFVDFHCTMYSQPSTSVAGEYAI